MKQRSASRTFLAARSTKSTRAPRKLQAVQASRHLHAAPHRHTGHMLPRRSTSYPMLVMILLCVGVFLGGWTRYAAAATSPYSYGGPYPGAETADYTVTTSVPGPAPTQAATIDVPIEGDHFKTAPITITGSCPANTYIEVTRNGYFSGTAICEADGTYTISSDLFYGPNKLIAHDYNFTDVPGPESDAITVYLDEPPTPPVITTPTSPDQTTDSNADDTSNEPLADSGTTATSTPAKTTKTKSSSAASSGFSTNSTSTPALNAPAAMVDPLLLKTGFAFQGYYTGTQIIWQLDLEGGNAPYAVAVDWGDGTHGIVSRPASGNFRINHIYQKAGGYHGSYTVKFSATDAAGNQTFLQLLAIVNDRPAAVGVATTHSNGSNGLSWLSNGSLHSLFRYVWPSYGVVVLMLSSFWLGERREFKHLKPRLKKTRHA